MLERAGKHVAAAILAGGNARRLGGIAKGTLDRGGGVSIAGRLIKEIAASGIGDIVIVANDSRPYRSCGVNVISDIRTGIGPLGGIEAALVHFAGRADAVMCVPCDMPNLSAGEMSALQRAFVETEKPVVFAETAGFFWHPLCAVVHIGLQGQIASAIDCGMRKIRDVWRQVGAETVRFSQEDAFFNINEVAYLDRWRKAPK